MLIRCLFAAASLGLAMAPIAAATPVSEDRSAPTVRSNAEIEQRLAAEGFRVYEVERYPNWVEVKGIDRFGACVELHLDPNSGEVLRRERDDDCGARRSGRHGRGRDHQ